MARTRKLAGRRLILLLPALLVGLCFAFLFFPREPLPAQTTSTFRGFTSSTNGLEAMFSLAHFPNEDDRMCSLVSVAFQVHDNWWNWGDHQMPGIPSQRMTYRCRFDNTPEVTFWFPVLITNVPVRYVLIISQPPRGLRKMINSAAKVFHLSSIFRHETAFLLTNETTVVIPAGSSENH